MTKDELLNQIAYSHNVYTEILKHIKEYCHNKSNSIEDRWEMFCYLPSFFYPDDSLSFEDKELDDALRNLSSEPYSILQLTEGVLSNCPSEERSDEIKEIVMEKFTIL